MKQTKKQWYITNGVTLYTTDMYEKKVDANKLARVVNYNWGGYWYVDNNQEKLKELKKEYNKRISKESWEGK